MSNELANTTGQGQAKSGGIMDMSGGTGDMAFRLAEMSDKLDLVKTFFKTQMTKDIDFGIIPGTDKPALFKAGAEKLCALYGFSQRALDKTGTRDIATGYYLAEVTVQLTHAASGVIVADGVGECSSYESKYRYRWVFESDIPKNIDKAGLVSKTFESKKTGKEYTRYRLENPDLIDQWNTVLKMAKKRALVDATLAATRTSGMFCQTEGELDAWMDGDEIPKQEKLEKQKAAPSATDEKSTFNPTTSGGLITLAQKNKIHYDAKGKNIKAEDIEAIVKAEKQKPMEQLTKAEASAVIAWLSKVTAEDLQDLLIDVAMDGGK